MSNRLEELEKENQELREKLEYISTVSQQKRKQKRGVLKFIGHTLAGRKLKSSIYNVLDQYHARRNVTRDAISDLLASVVYRLTRVGVFALIFAILPSVLLIQQNILLKRQNEKIQDQNYLAEASRRSGQMFIMGDVLSDINSELRQGNRELSPVLAGRIASLSRAMKPYRYYENGVLINAPMSPERGQLLITLSKSGIAHNQLSDAIFQNGDFSHADLANANLHHSYLKDIRLDYSDLNHADLAGSNLFDVSLRHAKLNHADLTDAKLHVTDFSHADLSNANLRFADIKNVNFSNAILDGVKVDRPDWLDHIKNTLKLKGAKTLFDTYSVDSLATVSGEKVPTLVRQKSLF